MPDLTMTMQWYELVWLVFMHTGGAFNSWVLWQSWQDRVAFRRDHEERGLSWRDSPVRIVVVQQLRSTAFSWSIQAFGVFLGWWYATSAPQAPSVARTGNPTSQGAVLTLFLLYMSFALAVKPWLNLRDNRRLYGNTAGVVPEVVTLGIARRAKSVDAVLGVAVTVAAIGVACYCATVYQDLLNQSKLDNGLPFDTSRYVSTVLRGLSNALMTGAVAALLMGYVTATLYKIRGWSGRPGE